MIGGLLLIYGLVSGIFGTYYFTKKDDKKAEKAENKSTTTQVQSVTITSSATITPSVTVTPSALVTATPEPKKQHSLKLISPNGNGKQGYEISFTSDNAILDYGTADNRKTFNKRTIILTGSDFKMNLSVVIYVDSIGWEGDSNSTTEAKNSELVCSNCPILNNNFSANLFVNDNGFVIEHNIYRYLHKNTNYRYVQDYNHKTNLIDLTSPSFKFGTSKYVGQNSFEVAFFEVTCTKTSNLTKCDNVVKSMKWAYKTY